MSYLVVSGTCVQKIKVYGDSTSDDSRNNKLHCKEEMKIFKSDKADEEDEIIAWEQVLGGRGESSIIRYY